MRISALVFALAVGLCAAAPAWAGGHYLFVWAGDRARQGTNFLVVVDADPASPGYGRLVSGVGTDIRTAQPHHTEYEMPAGGFLFANDHASNRTAILDVRNPLKPAFVTSFGALAGYTHPHSFLRLPNGNVLASFQHAAKGGHAGHGGHGGADAGPAPMGKSGGLVEIDDKGRVVRAVANADPAFKDAILLPYSLVVLPEIDRVVSTNSSMHDDDILTGVTYQVWRLSDLKLLRTDWFDPGETRTGHISPEEPRRGPDGSIYVQTLSCGIQRISGVETDTPQARLVHTFPGNWCGVPTIVGRFLIQAVPALGGVVVLDLADPARPREVSRLSLGEGYAAHWTGWDAKAKRLVVTSGRAGDRLHLLTLDEKTGAVAVDTAFRDVDGRPGLSFEGRAWPHGWQGAAEPHGAVFTR